jgi:secreted trypsin-like serine protease
MSAGNPAARRSLSGSLSVVLTALAIGTLLATVTPTTAETARRRDRQARTEVVSGSDVSDGAFPFVVALGTVSESGGIDTVYCGGSLIAPSYVLTAAHCVRGEETGEVAVIVGQTAFGTNQGVQRSVAAIAIHPGFSSRTGINDVAVLTLDQPVDGIAPIALVGAGDGSFETAGAALTLVGWGDTVLLPHPRKRARFPMRLQQRDIAVVSDARCARQWRKSSRKRFIVDSQTLCTTAHGHGPGDSGGPLFATYGGTPIQVSLVSSAYGGDSDHQVSSFGPQLSAPEIRGFIAAVAGV